MKKLLVLLGILCAFCFVSCGNIQLAGGDMGVVSLAIGDELAGQIRSAAASRNAGVGAYTVTASIRGEYSDSQSVTVADSSLAGASFTFENIPVGKNIILDLTAKADGNYIWYGNSGKHTVERGENLLTITLGRVSGVLMWDSSSVKIAPYGNYEAAENTSSSIQAAPVFCFDENGNIYWYADGQNGAQRFDLQADGSSISSDEFYNNSPFYAFTHDATTDILYGIGDGGSVKYWSGTGNDSKDITTSDGDGSSLSGADSLGFVVHANTVYVATYGEIQDGDGPILGVVQLSSYNLKDSPDDGSKTATPILTDKTFTLPESFGSNSPSGQMIYHEGALYLLLSRVSIDPMYDASVPTESYSLGAVLKINPNTLALDTSFGSQGYLGLASTNEEISNIDESDDGVTGGTVVYHGPMPSNDSSVFYGPQGFVAIMPKKLVIADAGFSMSKDEKKIALTKKSRIVTVDLETLAFETVDVEDTYYQPSITSTGSGYNYIK